MEMDEDIKRILISGVYKGKEDAIPLVITLVGKQETLLNKPEIK